jgi:NAD-dependent DNA ligase
MAEAAIDAGLIQSLGDLYRITEGQLANLDMDGRKIGGAARRALESLQATKEMPLATFVGSLGIDLCGRRMVEMLVAAGFDTLKKLDAATVAFVLEHSDSKVLIVDREFAEVVRAAIGLMQAVALALVCPASAHECDRARSRVARKILDVEVYNKVRTAPGRRPQDGQPVP